MSQVLGAFGLLDFTMDSVSETYEPFISLIFNIFFSGRGKPRIFRMSSFVLICICRSKFCIRSSKIPITKYEQAYRVTHMCLQSPPMQPYSHGHNLFSSFQFKKNSEMRENKHEMAFHIINILVAIKPHIRPVLG
jgi:hypothetical protein